MSGKNDWLAGDNLIRNSMNQPMWLVSGTIAGTGDGAGVARVFVGQGIMRWAAQPNPVVNAALTSFSFGPVSANTSYAIFLRRGGSTYMVSGNGNLITLASNVTPPRWDAEPIGIVQVTSPADTAHFLGPWNSATTGLAIYEQRGQYNAISSARSRAVFINTIDDSSATGNIAAAVNAIASASGIGWLSLDDSTNQSSDQHTALQATISWVPSGALTASALYLCPQFTIAKSSDYRSATWIVNAKDQKVYTVAQDPDNQSGGTTRGSMQAHTTSLSAVNMMAGGADGYVLTVNHDAAVQRSDSGGAIRVVGVTFVALPGLRASAGTEPT